MHRQREKANTDGIYNAMKLYFGILALIWKSQWRYRQEMQGRKQREGYDMEQISSTRIQP